MNDPANQSGQIHVVHDGPRDAPALLLIHGSGASGATWGPVVPRLAADHHMIRVDLPGCGQSPPARTYDVPAQADRVAALLDTLDVRRPTVAGHSSGGYVATALAERRPDLVGRLALISTGPSPDALLKQPAFLRVMLSPPLGPLVWRARSDALIRRGVSAILAQPVHIPDDAVAELKRTTYRTMRAVLRDNTAYITERSVPDRIAALKNPIPTLVIFGGSDPRWNPASARQYGVVPTAHVRFLPNVGHVAMLEAPEATAALVSEFTVASHDTRLD